MKSFISRKVAAAGAAVIVSLVLANASNEVQAAHQIQRQAVSSTIERADDTQTTIETRVIVIAGQLKTGPSTPTGPGTLKSNPTRQKAVCTSTDGKKTCHCGEKNCIATESACNCLVTTPPPTSNSRD
jgi:hypothetical protein